METSCIYVFSDEFGVPKYVGKAKNLNVRLKQHLNRDRFRYTSYFYNWLNKCISEEREYFIDKLEDVNSDNWKEREIFWIKHIKENGYKLTNMTDGGDGNNNQVFTIESRAKRSERMLNHEVSQETRNRISKGHLGKTISVETRDKISQYNMGKPCLESTKLKFSKLIEQYDLNGDFIQKFTSLTEAAKFLKCRKSSLSNGIKRNKNGKFKKFLWKYV